MSLLTISHQTEVHQSSVSLWEQAVQEIYWRLRPSVLLFWEVWWMWAPTSVSPWAASALWTNFIKCGHGSAVWNPGWARRSDSCLTECNNCDAAVGVLLRRGNGSISEPESNGSSSAAVEADPLRAASTEKYSEFNWTEFPPPPDHLHTADVLPATSTLVLFAPRLSLETVSVHCKTAGNNCTFYFLNPHNNFSDAWAEHFQDFFCQSDIVNTHRSYQWR